MAVLDTWSRHCKIIEKDNQKYVIRYARKCGVTQEYYCLIPESEVIEILQKYDIQVPKLVYKDDECNIQEYISGDVLSDVYKDYAEIDKNIIDQIVEQICYMSRLQDEQLKHYSEWEDNKSFFKFYCKNTENVFCNYYDELSELYEEFNIHKDIMEKIYGKIDKIDNNRKMSVIHGDRNKKNVVLNNGNVFYIDWEQACMGDIAYDIAFHIYQMTYTESDEKYFIKKLKEKYIGNVKKLLEDVEIYKEYALLRSTLYLVKYTLEQAYSNNIENEERKKKALLHFMNRYNNLSNYEKYNLKAKTEDEIDNIFEYYSHR